MCRDHADLDADAHGGRVAAGDGGAAHDNAHAGAGSGGPIVTRRRLLAAGAAVAAGAAGVGLIDWRRHERPLAADGARAVAMAMHVHSAFSEQSGSMEAHLHQAQAHGVDVVWWTEHDFRMSGLGYRREVHFTSLTEERGGPGQGAAWEWRKSTSGPLAAGSGGGIVAAPASPLDPVPGGSLRVSAEAARPVTASVGFAADATKAGWNYHGTLNGQTLYLEVLPADVGRDGYLELLVSTSYHPARNGRPAGLYTLSYRFGGDRPPGSRSTDGLVGVVTVPAAVGRWNSIVLRPTEDIAALWPDMDARDFASFGLSLSAVSTGGPARGYFDYLRISRQTSGEVQLQAQREMQARYAPHYPGVAQYQGLEVSRSTIHLNWFGGGVTLPDYAGVTPGTYPDFLRHVVIPDIHQRGGLASYNHPFGAGWSAALPEPTQRLLMRQAATAMLADGAIGADILEVGYRLRGGVDLPHHIGLWDICSRNALFLTGSGTSDDHWATTWTGIGNDWVTWVWTPGTAEPALLSALRAGRAWTTSLSYYRGVLDLVADGGNPMGSVSVSGAGTRRLAVTASDLPPGSTVQVVRGVVDRAGGDDLRTGTAVIASHAADEFRSGPVTVPVDCTESCFARTIVHDRTNRIVGLSNPVWLFRDQPPTGTPATRGG